MQCKCYLDPCEDKRCGPGRECLPTEQGKAKCVCMAKCPPEVDNRRRVTKFITPKNSTQIRSIKCAFFIPNRFAVILMKLGPVIVNYIVHDAFAMRIP